MTAIELGGDIDAARLRRRLQSVGIGAAVEIQEWERILATRPRPIRVIVVAEVTVGLDEADRAELADLLREAATAADDDSAWRPIMRARRLLQRSAPVPGRGIR
jgi:hypothetical protein